jgi:soluble cytochrome b562
LAEQMPGASERTVAEALAAALVAAALNGDVAAAREIADRTEGKAKQQVDVDLSIFDWRELARAHGLSEQDVIREAQRLITESALDSGGAATD